MNKGYIFPIVLITLDLCAGVVYLANGDVRKFVYWIAAAVLNIAVTFQEKNAFKKAWENIDFICKQVFRL